ncbi:MAG: hypothetical protein IPG22_15335 [Acidobacteria bacterium]|nr:hypothetical protein [Acidobacteriota bacterium]
MMKPRTYERYFLTANFYELCNGRRPDFRARAAVKNLARVGVKASFERHDDKFVRVTASATAEKHVTYLEIRGYQLKNPKRTKATKPQPSYSDVVKTILARPKTGEGGGIPLTRGEVAMLFLDGYAGDGPSLLDMRSQGYGEDDLWDGLTTEDVLEDENTAFVWTKWEPLELWPG